MTKATIMMSVLCLTISPVVSGTVPDEERAALNRLPGLDMTVQLNCDRSPLSKVIGSMASAAPFRVEFEGSVGDTVITLKREEESLKEALINLAELYDLAYGVSKSKKLIVRRRVKSKKAE